MYLGQLCHCFLEGSELDPQVGDKCTVQFPEINLKWPKIEHLKDYQDAVHIFKLGNTQVQKALAYFVIDGYVTEHVKLRQIQSKLYKQLLRLEQNKDRVVSINQRRLDILEPLNKDLNPSAYVVFLQEISVELSEIYVQLFDLKNDEITSGAAKRTKAKI